MADAIVERRPAARFFCHRCNIEFEDVLQDYVCPYCASGFIEQLENESEDMVSFSSDMNLEDQEEPNQSPRHPVFNDIALLMSGGRVGTQARPETFLEQLVWTIGGGVPTAATGGAPFMLVGTGDYVFTGEGLDSVVTQLLGQLENTGPPPLSRGHIAAIPSEDVTPEQAAGNTSCSVCWENFQIGDKIKRLQCDHMFHTSCIEPWLQLHATCPICRRSLLPDAPSEAPAPPPADAPSDAQGGNSAANPTLVPRVLLRRLPRRILSGLQNQNWVVRSPAESSSSTSTPSSMTLGDVWTPRSNTSSTNSNSSTSINSSDRDRTSQYNMDIDYD